MGAVRIEELRKEFDNGDIIAVEDINFQAQDGEMVVILGPSGCGKSTTLRCISGLELPTGGHIYLDEKDITYQSPRERNIAMVFQDYALYPHMTAGQNMSFGLKKSTDMGLEEINSKVQGTAEMMGIEDQLDQLPSELSGGQQQRVALGRALVRDPEVFLMDEPLSNLDAKLREQMRSELKRLHQKYQTTTFYVTHNQDEAMTLADRIIIMDQGKIKQIGTPLECYYSPNDTFVANFVGSPGINLFDVMYSATRGIISEEFREAIDVKYDVHEGKYILGIRPEDVEITDRESGEIEATVILTEPMGDQTHVTTTTGSEEIVLSTEGSIKINEGDTIGLHFPEEHIYLFEGETGESILSRSIPNQQNSSTLKETSA
jgi:multiple sugar transport system ATP-binding protein